MNGPLDSNFRPEQWIDEWQGIGGGLLVVGRNLSLVVPIAGPPKPQEAMIARLNAKPSRRSKVQRVAVERCRGE